MAPSFNSSSGFSGLASGEGDADLNALLTGVGAQPNTSDASSIAFNFEPPNGAAAVQFTFFFGSEEFPDQGGFTDIAGVFIDGVNVLKFLDGSPVRFLSGSPQNQSYFTANDGQIEVEYDGLTSAMSVIHLLNEDQEFHAMKLAVSDTIDSGFDSALFIGDFRFLTSSEILTSTPDPFVLGDFLIPDIFEDLILASNSSGLISEKIFSSDQMGAEELEDLIIEKAEGSQLKLDEILTSQSEGDAIVVSSEAFPAVSSSELDLPIILLDTNVS